MVAIRHMLSGFLAGEISPMMSGRVDTNHYAYGLDKCENFVPTNEGPIVKRPGFEYICDADDTSSWLTPFRFSITQEYAIEWGEELARFYTNGGRIETAPGVPYELVTPYAAADAPALSFQQSYDRYYLDHGSYAPAVLTRTSAVTFTLADLEFRNGPFRDQNSDETITVTASAASGSGITITASSAIFAAGHVGAWFQIQAKDYSTVKAWEAGMKGVVIGEKVRSDGKVYEAESDGKTGANPPIHTEGSEWDGQLKNDELNDKGPYGVQWKYLHDRFGMVQITAVAPDGLSCTADVKRRLPDQVTSVATYRWNLPLFSAATGWPSLVLHWQGRQVHIKDFDFAASVVGDYGGGRVNYQSYTSSALLAADLAFRRTMSTEDPPLWAMADKKLLVGSASKELTVGPINSAQAVAGDNVTLDAQSYYGSEAVRPVQVGTSMVFVERGGRRLRAASFDLAQDRFVPEDLTAAARHVTKGGVVQLAYQRVPHALLYAVRGDGQIVVHPWTKLEIKGFGRIVPGGDARALSAVSIVGADGKSDELWLLVERTRADGVKREIWKQAEWRDHDDDQREAFFVDCGTRFTASAGDVTFTGFTHLAGQAVSVLANGGVVRGVTMAEDGSFSVPAEYVPADAPYTVVVGLPFTAEAVVLRAPASTRNGPLHGLRQWCRKAVVRLLGTLGLQVGGANDTALQDMIDRPGDAAMDAPIPLFTGDTAGPIDQDFTLDGRIRLVSSDPLPATIAAVILSIEADEADA